MRTLDAVRALFHPGQIIRVVENTKRAELDGTLRLLTKVAARAMEATVLTGPGEGTPGFRMPLPTRAGDVVAIDATTVSYRFGNGAHTLTLSTVAVIPDAATLRSRIATPAELAATDTAAVASDGPYAILDGQRLIAIADDYATICWTADGVSQAEAEAAHAVITDAATASPPPSTATRVRVASSNLQGLPIGAAGTVAQRGTWAPVVRFDLDGSERAVVDDDMMVQRGRLIVVEGPAGVGTTTTAAALRDALALHVPVQLVCEPGGRDRAVALVDDVVTALLAEGVWVIVDRPAGRSLAHGVVDDELGVGEAVRDCVFDARGVHVDRTLLLDVTARVARERWQDAAAPEVPMQNAGVFFMAAAAVHRALTGTWPQRFVTIDAGHPVHGVAAAALAALDDLLWPACDVVCVNPAHDHYGAPGEEISASWSPPSARRCADGQTAVLTRAEPRRCNGCGAPTHYDHGVHGWRHDDPDVVCFLEADGLRGASACVAPAVAVPSGLPHDRPPQAGECRGHGRAASGSVSARR